MTTTFWGLMGEGGAGVTISLSRELLLKGRLSTVDLLIKMSCFVKTKI
jgi:hypothetical protein